MKRMRGLLALIVLPLWASAAMAQHTYTPAAFIDGGSKILERIRFPSSNDANKPDLTLMVLCDGEVATNGNFTLALCWSQSADGERYTRAVTSALRRDKLRPAEMDGERKRVFFQYSVVFERKAGVESIKIFPHQFVGIVGDGKNYSAPQRYYVQESEVLDQNCLQREQLWFSMEINKEGGKPSRVAHVEGETNPGCIEKLANKIGDSLYIPAFLNGEPVTVPHLEGWFFAY